jgi:hypothetical protein
MLPELSIVATPWKYELGFWGAVLQPSSEADAKTSNATKIRT